MPKIGYGIFRMTGEKECEEAVVQAIKTGYRLIQPLLMKMKRRWEGQLSVAVYQEKNYLLQLNFGLPIQVRKKWKE